MSGEYSQIWPFLIAALAVFLIYRRFRRLFGRQELRPVRMSIRIGILLLFGISLLPLMLRSAQMAAVEAVGTGLGVALALWGASRTRYQKLGEQIVYIPHTYTGIAVSLLVAGRLVYRLALVYSTARATDSAGFAAPPPGFDTSAMLRSPLTVGIFFVLIGYYVCYYSLVLWKSKHLRAEDFEVSPPVQSGDAAPRA